MKKNDEQAWKTIASKLRSYEEPAPAEGWSRLAKELQADEPAPVRRLWGVRPAVRWAVAAVLLGCEMSIQEMAERGLPVHPNTIRARDWLLRTKG